MKRNVPCLLLLLPLLLIPVLSSCVRAGTRLDRIELPPGFTIAIYADQLPGARSMALGPDNILFVGSRAEGAVYAVLDPEGDRDGDHRADRVVTVARNLNSPNGVAFRNGSLYVAEVNRVLRFDDIVARLDRPGEPVVVNDDFPDDRHHGWKFIRFGPDGKLYVPVGAPCNICEPGDPYAAILRMNADGTGLEVFARGVRNTVGFDFHPRTGELWFTDNGRDWLGDDRPPDELNRAPAAGLHFGYPYRHGQDIVDPEYGARADDPARFTPPALELGPHVASLGLRFYTGAMFPAEYRDQIFIAEHGSWNRTAPIGYRLSLVRLKDNRAVSYEVFAQGWFTGGSAWGRPVDVQVMADGALLVSDDKAGVIYRISYSEPGAK